MRVALDGSPLTVETGGIRRYTEQLHAALVREFPRDQFEIIPSGAGRWWSWGLPRALMRGRFQVFHGTDFHVPYLPVRPSVMTVHDLSPWKDEPWRAASNRVRRRTPWLLRLGMARRVVTPSEAVRRELTGRFGLREDRVITVPLGVDPRFRPVDAPRGNYFLMVGTIEPRKNVEAAIGAWRELRARGHGVELWLAGRNLQGIREEPGLRLLGAVPDDQLPELYSRSVALLFPSHYEGFGLPVLEAFACGTAVIASRDTALREVAGGFALHPESNWTEAMEAVLKDPSWRGRGIVRARQFTWEGCARRMHEIYGICAH